MSSAAASFFSAPVSQVPAVTRYDAYNCKPNVIKVVSEPTGQVICTGEACERSNDQVAMRIHRIAEKLLLFFAKVFKVCGVDGQGSVPPLSIHWDVRNAQWISTGTYTKFRFHDAYAVMPEVVGHEYTHGIVHHFGQLQSGGQPGALNESISDAFGFAFRDWLRGRQSNWVLGDGIRNASDHVTMQSYKTGRAADGNVHDNSRIPTHAFYCAVQWTETKSYGVIAKIWFRALKDVSITASFREFALRTVFWAKKATNDAIAPAVAKSWVHVGVLVCQVVKPIASGPQAGQRLIRVG